jgi:thermitase
MAAYSILPEVSTVEKVYQISASRTPNDTYYSIQWSLSKIQAPQAWDTITTTPVKISIIDTGIDSAHSDLQGITITKGRDWINGDTDPNDEDGHGTFVAGQIGAATNNSLGIAGVVWQSKLFISKVLDSEGNGTTTEVISAIDEAITAQVKVINMSIAGLGMCTSTPSLQTVITRAYNAGITIVVAAGNNNDNAANYIPASCLNTLVVGASTTTDSRAMYSNFGSIVKIAAPGGDGTTQSTLIVSTIPSESVRISSRNIHGRSHRIRCSGNSAG